MRLEGKTALITGASRNIGRETALTFAREGADLALSSLQSPQELEEVAAECRELGVKTYTATADIADGDQCRRLVAGSLEALGKIDVLVSNAAIRPHHPLLSVTDEDWHKVFGINLHSTFYLAKAALPGMMERETGEHYRHWGNGGDYREAGHLHGYRGQDRAVGVYPGHCRGVCAVQHPGQHGQSGDDRHGAAQP